MKSNIGKVASNCNPGIILIGFLGAISLFALSSDIRYLLAPVLATIFITLQFVITLIHRRNELPLADPAIMVVLATVCYTVVPPLQFLLSGMQHTIHSASQLYALQPTPDEFSSLTWWYVAYLLSFVIGYLVFDQKGSTHAVIPRTLDHTTIKSLIIIFILLSGIMLAIEKLYGINLYGVYDSEFLYDSYDRFLQMPLFFRQFYGIISHCGILFIVKLGLLLTIFLNWEKRAYRYVFYAWMLIMIINNILWMGARTELVLILLAAGIMYHQFVKHFKLRTILLGGFSIFAVFVIMGMMRGNASLGANLENFKDTLNSQENISSSSNEFEALFGGNYDLLKMRQNELLGEVPLQFLLYDIIMIIPQQILPFEKLDVQQWYMNKSCNPGFFMFNPISQSIIGFGWGELVLRGLFLGFIFARLRAWYICRESSFWATYFYFYLVIISYYMIRGTAIYTLLACILFRFMPLYFLVWVLNYCMKSVRAPVPD